MKIPINKDWLENVNTFKEQTNKNGFQLIDPEVEKNKFTFGILLQTDNNINNQLHEILKTKIPESLASKLFLQPQSGYHITLQWTELPDETVTLDYKAQNSNFTVPSKKDSIAKQIIEQIKNNKPLITTITGPYASAKNIFFAVTTNADVQKIREGLDKVLKAKQLETKLPLAFNLLWISVCRFIEQPSELERHFLLEDLEQEKLENVEFNKAIVAANDPFFSNSSQIIAQVELEE